MPRFRVTVEYTMKRDLGVYARDEEQAMERAEQIVSDWRDVQHAEAVEVEQDDNA